MSQRSVKTTVLAALLLLACGGGTIQAAKYDYGSGTAGKTADAGFFLYLDLLLMNPRNTDAVVATGRGASTVPIIPRWTEEASGRIGFGYQWASGNRIQGSVWSFSTDTRAAGSTPIYLAIGPPVPAGDEGTSLDILTEIEAGTFDIAWGRTHPLTESFSMDWSAGLRYANFKESMNGVYGGVGGQSYTAEKSNEGEMFGVRVGAEGRYWFNESFSFEAGVGFSFLDGEITALSGLTLVGASLPSTVSAFTDDSRSGNIIDFDAEFSWHARGDKIRVSLGWEQSVWNDIAADLVRNFPGTTVNLRDRTSVTFSAYRLGLFFRF